MYTVHTTIHARPTDAIPGPTISLGNVPISTVSVPRESLNTPFSLSFEQASEALSRLPRMFCEPDGSFVWAGSADEESWQLDGVLYDRDDRLLFVDLNGTCPPQAFDDLLHTLGWPGVQLVFQLTHEAVFLDEPTFRRWAATPSSQLP